MLKVRTSHNAHLVQFIIMCSERLLFMCHIVFSIYQLKLYAIANFWCSISISHYSFFIHPSIRSFIHSFFCSFTFSSSLDIHLNRLIPIKPYRIFEQIFLSSCLKKNNLPFGVTQDVFWKQCENFTSSCIVC